LENGARKVQVEWEMAKNHDGSRSDEPGAEGHSGICKLAHGKENRSDKERRLELRSRLADMATISPVPVPHDIPDEHIKVAAYFIYQSGRSTVDSRIGDWINAIRQLRRARVQQQLNRNSGSAS
jgi:hypothetical protein